VRLATVLLLTFLAASAGAWPEDGPKEVAAALTKERNGLIGRLESHATWCGEARLSLERDRVFEMLLRLKPDHARARAGLKYTRKGKGEPWVQQGYKAPKNWEVGKLPEAQERLARILDGYAERVLAVVHEAGERLPARERDAAREHVMDVAPDHAPLRKDMAHVEHGGRWLLPESVEGLARRKRFAEMRAEAQRTTPAPGIDAKGVSLGWSGAHSIHGFSVRSQEPREAQTIVTTMARADAFCRAAVGPADAKEVRVRLVCLADRQAAVRWLAGQGAEYAAARRDVEKFGTLQLPSDEFLTYVGDTLFREGVALRYVVGRWIHRIGSGPRDRGWVSEGVGQRLAWSARLLHGPNWAGSERTEAAGASDDDAAPAVELPPRDAAWLGAAARVLEREPVQRMASLLTRRLNAMGPEDVLAAYALAAYLLEGRPDALRPLVEASLELDDPEAQVRQALDVDVATLAWRVRRYVIEAAALEETPREGD
jgi:hypothetical protein